MPSALSVQYEVFPSDSTDMATALANAHPTAAKALIVVDPSAVEEQMDGIIKQLDALHEVAPDTVLIGRVLAGETACENFVFEETPPETIVEAWWKVMQPVMERAFYVYWEGPYNEFGLWQYLDRLNAVETLRQQRMAEQGYKACIGNFSAHACLFDKFQPFKPALDLAKAMGNIYGTHGYLSPNLFGDQANTYLYNYRPLRGAYGELPAVVMTEFGIDRIPGLTEYDGWRTVPNMDAETYFNQLLGTDAEMQKDGVAACIYLWTNQDQEDKVPYNVGSLGNRRGEPVVMDMLLNHIANAGAAALHFPPITQPIVRPVRPPAPVPEAPGIEGALANPSFEGATVIQDAEGKMRVPEGWTAWWRQDQNFGPPNIETEQHPPHVTEGTQSARVYTAYQLHDAGLYQVAAATPGTIYRFSADGLAWCPDNPVVGEASAADMTMMVGIDPTGGTDPLASSVVWSTALRKRDDWVRPAAGAIAQGERITVFLRSMPDYPMARNDAFWDNALIEIVSGPIEVSPLEIG